MLDPKLLVMFAVGALLVLNGLFAGGGVLRGQDSEDGERAPAKDDTTETLKLPRP